MSLQASPAYPASASHRTTARSTSSSEWDSGVNNTVTRHASCAGSMTDRQGILLPSKELFDLEKALDSAKKIGPETLRQQRPALTTTRKDRDMANSAPISVDRLRQFLRYDPECGFLYWRARPSEHFKSNGSCKTWNKRFANTRAGNSTRHGYIDISISGRHYYAHRVALALLTGKWPTGQVDHINGVRNDNRSVNLREVSSLENSKNVRKRVDNSSGVVGVNRHGRRWKASIKCEGSQIHLGCFDTIEEAGAARKGAERALGYHPNHGREPGGHSGDIIAVRRV